MGTETHQQQIPYFSMMLPIALLALGVCNSVSAQENDSGGSSTMLEEITVTAQRRAQSVNDVPISVTALRGDELRDRGVQNFKDLIQTVPNLAMTSFYASRPEITIRGMAMSESFLSTDQQPVGVYLDDVFLGSRAVHLAQLYDLDRVEILRGPQGVLFGRNTTAGAVNYISKMPEEEFGGYARAGYGNFNSVEVSGALNVPIAESWGLRVSGISRSTDGWARNTFTNEDAWGHDSWAARAILQYSGENSTWTLNVHGSDYDGDENYYFNPSIPDNQGLDWDEFQQRLQDADEQIEAFGGSLTGSFSLGELDVVSITSYETNDYAALEDFGVGSTGINNLGLFAQFAPFVAGYTDDYRQYSQEFRFSGGNEKLDWVGGLFFYDEEIDSQYSDGGFGVGTIGLDFNGNGVIDVPDEGWFPENDTRIWNQQTEEIAAFFHLNYRISDQFGLLAGVRYTDSEKDLLWQYTDLFTDFDYVPQTSLADSWDPITYRIGVEYKSNENSLYYARFDHGFKNGGFNVGGSTPADLAVVDEELVDSIELGAKLTLADGRTQLNIAAFHNTIEDYQANVAIPTPNGIGFGFRNAAKVTSQGAEVEVSFRPADTLLLTGSVGYVDSTYDEYVDPLNGQDFSGNNLPIVPDLTANFSISNEYSIGGGYLLSPRLDYAYLSEMEGRHYNYPDEVLDARNLINGQLKFEDMDGTMKVSIWIKNALDEEYRTKIIGNLAPFAPGHMTKRGWPRTYGISLEYNW